MDAGWQVPHFEKMLYDQAQLILAYRDGYTTTGDQLHLDVARRTAAFVLEELAIADGGFCSALDADSEGMEGKYYSGTRGKYSNCWERSGRSGVPTGGLTDDAGLTRAARDLVADGATEMGRAASGTLSLIMAAERLAAEEVSGG